MVYIDINILSDKIEFSIFRNFSNNKKIFIDNLEDDHHDKISKDYILLASNLGYDNFIKAISLF